MVYDVIVVGGGHAGCEAALAASRIGRNTLLVTINSDSIALMPCNPSIGGPGKAQLVRELDALGGEMALNADRSSLQTKTLNSGKGPAVRALRVQCDKDKYSTEMRKVLSGEKNLTVVEDTVMDILIDGKTIMGIRGESGAEYLSRNVVLTTGVYMDSRIIIGEESRVAGPGGEGPSIGLADALRRRGLILVRFKTGTSPRLLRRSIDFDRLKPEWGHDPPVRFSYLGGTPERPHLPCWLTRTSEETHRIIRNNLHRAPLFTGEIEGTGPRYCPSIEDKVVKFAERDSHQVFLEPEGETSEEVYVLGMSTSLPADVQVQMVHSVPGLEEAEISRFGYAIEYECLVPTQMLHSLEVGGFVGLYAAGQINGTSGYEEAAVQGLVAGVNAALACEGNARFTMDRSEGFIGVLIDDLVSKGTSEPYRMLTSRAEYRLLLRQDNADLRLTRKGYDLGLASEGRMELAVEKERMKHEALRALWSRQVKPDEGDLLVKKSGGNGLRDTRPLGALLVRPGIRLSDLMVVEPNLACFPDEVLYQVELETKYSGYIERQKQEVERFRRIEGRAIPAEMDYGVVKGLSFEARQKLEAARPRSVGEAMRVSGVTLSDVGLVLAALGSGKNAGGPGQRGRCHG